MRKPNPTIHAAQRAHLIAAARRCFARTGFAGTSTDAVRAEADTSSGKLFHYFPNKRALILAVVEDHNQQTRAWTDELLARPDPARALMDLMGDVLAIADDPEECRLILEVAAEAARDDEVAQLAAEGDRALADALRALVTAEADRSGAAIDIPQVVTLLMICIDGIFSRAGSDPDFSGADAAPAFRNLLGHLLTAKAERRHE